MRGYYDQKPYTVEALDAAIEAIPAECRRFTAAGVLDFPQTIGAVLSAYYLSPTQPYAVSQQWLRDRETVVERYAGYVPTLPSGELDG